MTDCSRRPRVGRLGEHDADVLVTTDTDVDTLCGVGDVRYRNRIPADERGRLSFVYG